MADEKTSIILVIDDLFANPQKQKTARETISDIAEALGYNKEQITLILSRVKFFDQYQKGDSDTLAQEYAKTYLQDLNGQKDEPVLVFVDNNFNDSQIKQHGREIIEDLVRLKNPPAMVWISRDPPPEVQTLDGLQKLKCSDKLFILNETDPEVIFDLAKSSYKEGNADEQKSQDQVMIHSLRDAFQTIAGSPKGPGVWQDCVNNKDRLPDSSPYKKTFVR